MPVNCPLDLIEFWRIADSARLFEDQQYGQWGLVLKSPEDAVTLTRHAKEGNPELCSTDLVVGEFLGDADLLAIRCDSAAADFGNIVIVSAIDPRANWDVPAKSFNEFLDRYIRSNGDKYWE